ncbi:MAG TPA: anti-sigma factor [Nitriliruptorales bacterium]|nr:anti-sigma factor [Nitriliruptorales bacterium]
MGSSHERYEELALGHVLGGLRSDDAAEFRAHLVECRECRMRVAELRDIAADLAATEREERRRAAIATEVAQSEDGEGETSGRWARLTSRLPHIGVALATLAVLGVMFWNYHLRQVSGEQDQLLVRWSQALAVLAQGEALPVQTRGEVTAVAAVEGDEVALVLTGIPAFGRDQLLYVWKEEDRADHAVAVEWARGPVEGPLSLVEELADADTLIVTLERAGVQAPEEPSDRELARVELGP